MMPDNSRILTINGGSSSIKFAVFETRDALRRVLADSIERIGLPGAELVMKGSQPADNFSRPVAAPDRMAAAGLLIDRLAEHIGGDALTAMGHRVVHVGPTYSEAKRVTREMVEESFASCAPTRNG